MGRKAVDALMDSNTAQDAADAARWYVRLRAEDCTLVERQAFQRWVEQSPAHASAYARARHISQCLDQLARQDPHIKDLAAEALRERPSRHGMPWRFAAALLLGVGLAALLVLQRGRPDAPAIAHYVNGGLQQQLIVLADGSRVHLDVGAKLDVQMTQSSRLLNLRAGRAYFEVTHDASRPFTVAAQGVQTVALGTRFQVALADSGVSVTLAEGSVAVSSPSGSGWREILRPGEQLQWSSAGAGLARRDIDAAAIVGWSNGRLVFKGTPLKEALEEINRYTPVKLRLGDEGLGKVPVGGTFVAGADSSQVANALAAALPINAVQVGAREIVLFRRDDAAD